MVEFQEPSRKKHGAWFFAVLLIAVFAAAIPKVFSIGVAQISRPVVRVENDLLITHPSSTLSEREIRAILRKLEMPLAKNHMVGRNEWMEKIARELGVPPISIRSTNNLEDPLLRPNQQILVQNKNGMFHVAKDGETIDDVVKIYEKLGGKREKILAANALDENTYYKDGRLYMIEGSKLWVPDARRSYPYLVRPVHWSRISSTFGVRRHPVSRTRRRHDGYDMVAPYGAPVYAGQGGVVVFAGEQGGYGNMIEIRHDKITTRYGHLSRINVETGQTVKRKQLIGRVGSTGISTGPHLHFEVRRNSDGKALRPGRYLY